MVVSSWRLQYRLRATNDRFAETWLTLVFGIPEVGFQDEQGHFMEKTQVDPDIQVMNDPKSTAEGRDLQLERAIAELMKETGTSASR